jgi:4a-hydroxytetrahydrobiopterin dehydratase
MPDTLTKETCGPCHGEGTVLTTAEIPALMAELPGWELAPDGKAITRRYTFKDFAAALACINHIGALAEAEGHHPDLTLGWSYVGVTLTTHHFGALTRNDVILAAKIEALEPART